VSNYRYWPSIATCSVVKTSRGGMPIFAINGGCPSFDTFDEARDALLDYMREMAIRAQEHADELHANVESIKSMREATA
jgi:hypothetical protein